jgi:hypothetical protein
VATGSLSRESPLCHLESRGNSVGTVRTGDNILYMQLAL